MLLEYNLQFFAQDGPGGEKTEEPTGKRLNDARKDGQVAKSREITNVVSLFALFLLLRFWTGHMGRDFLELFQGIYSRIPEVATFLLIGFMIAFITNLLQVGWMVTFKPMQPKFSKFNPVNGVKRLFSLQSLIELVKSIAKLALIFYVAYSYFKSKQDLLFLLYDMPLLQVVQLTGSLIFGLGIRICAFYVLIAALDFAYQKYKFHNDMKMTKQEVKDEMKESEGDPQIKSKQRQRMQEASRRRMMQAVPQADVVITNPTHYAVAVAYDANRHEAPVVLAKGSDYLAAKIREAAAEHGVQIVENKPLARMLYANVEIGEEIPPELYAAVAEVLAYVYSLEGKVG